MDNNKHKRKFIRLKDYNYTQNGMYYITICTKEQRCLFGEIRDYKVKLNNAGEIIKKWIEELGNKFQNIGYDEYVIMPNHIHLVINIFNSNKYIFLNKIVQWFKTMTTNEYIKGIKSGIFPKFDKSLWQRNYYEHIIRDDNDLNRIRKYIIENPIKWQTDIYWKAQTSVII